MLQDWKTCQPITDKQQNHTTKSALDLQRELQNLMEFGNLSVEEYNPSTFQCRVHYWDSLGVDVAKALSWQ